MMLVHWKLTAEECTQAYRIYCDNQISEENYTLSMEDSICPAADYAQLEQAVDHVLKRRNPPESAERDWPVGGCKM